MSFERRWETRLTRMHGSVRAGIALFALLASTVNAGSAPPKTAPSQCQAVTFEGEVRAGEAFRKEFTLGLEFFLEPLASGWIVRVLEMRGGKEVRGPHDWAEVATPPYRSVSPLLLSTDWAFRAQDAGAWNPREFRYVDKAGTFARLAKLEDEILSGNRKAEGEDAALVVALPEGSLKIENLTLVPGLRNQSSLAAAVASHWAQTPHEVVQGEPATALGRLVALRFRVRLDLPTGLKPSRDVGVQRFSCKLRPTG
jgi:hypothetical protein